MDVEASRTGLLNILSYYSVGEDVALLLESLTAYELIMSCFAASYPLFYGGDGAGLFAGISRYQYLASRLEDGLKTQSTFAGLWNFVSKKLGLGMPSAQHFDKLRAFFVLPKSVQAAAIKDTANRLELIVMAGRAIADSIKELDKEKKDTGKPYSPSDAQIESLVSEGQDQMVVSVPSVSGNSIRHSVLREPSANRLLTELGLEPYSDMTSAEALGFGVTRMLYHGGHIAAKAKAPRNASVLEAIARQKYPSLDALGGSTDAWLMSASKVKVAAWIVCEENNQALEAIAGIQSSTSIFDLLSEQTYTRSGFGGSDKESGQMIYTTEVLAKGVEILLELSFTPFTSNIVKGAVYQAYADWLDSGGTLAAKSAIGHSKFSGNLVEGEQYTEEAKQYLSYLKKEKEALRAGLLDGTFGSGGVLCAA